jgi:hypothetical protein
MAVEVAVVGSMAVEVAVVGSTGAQVVDHGSTVIKRRSPRLTPCLRNRQL